MVERAIAGITPTLARMAQIYALDRKGGRESPRFAAYLGEVEHHWGLAGYNPMAGADASAAVAELLTLDAETLAQAAAQDVMERCDWTETITLAVVVASPGMWTDRLATEVRHRTDADRRAAHGEILLWATDVHSVDTIATESAAEAVRTMWTSLHGPARSLHAILAREGMAYAVSRATTARDCTDARVDEAIDILGDTTVIGDIVAILYGDAAAMALGYTPLGIGERAGHEYAIARAGKLIAREGASRTLRAGPAALFQQD